MTFPNGIRIADRKGATQANPIESGPLPDEIILPLQQHAGAACEPRVQVKDKVLAGQRIAEATAPVSAPIHSPVSGEVTAIERRPHHTGLKLPAIVIRPDGEQTGFDRAKPPLDPDAGDIRRLVSEAGIVGLGGAGFPTGIKLTPPAGARIDDVIINGCECEPYLTADHRIMVEEGPAVVDGLRLIMKCVGAKRGFIAIETNKPNALDLLGGLTARDEQIIVTPVEAKYPQGSEKQLIKSILGREVPSKGLPSMVGALVQNVATAAAVSKAVRWGEPLTSKVLTVSGGGVIRPANIRVLIGTPVRDVLAACGGLSDQTVKLIVGGPMMGAAITDTAAPVVKSTSGVLALTADEIDSTPSVACIKCGRCVEACPMGLMPARMANLIEFGFWDELGGTNLFDCLECGSCAFVCPSRRPLVQYFRLGKYRATRVGK